MIYTNKYGLPPLLAQVLMRPRYKLESNYSATGLIKPPQVVALERMFHDDIVIDVAQEIWSLFGQAPHYILSQTAGSDLLQEYRVKLEFGGITVQMTLDLYQISTGHLWDYKITSVWSAMKLKPEWEQQLNIYKFGLWTRNYPVGRADILAILRDWSLPQSRLERIRGNSDYPEVQVKVLNVPLWSNDATQRFIIDRIALHEAARDLTPIELAEKFPCSKAERWAKPTTYPIIRKMKGGERAASGTAKLETREEAEAWLAEKGKPGDRIEKRWGEQKRCEMYCAAAPFCHQFKAIKGE